MVLGAKKCIYIMYLSKQVAVNFHQLEPYKISNLVAYKQWYFPMFSRCTQNMFLWHWKPTKKMDVLIHKQLFEELHSVWQFFVTFLDCLIDPFTG